MKYKVGDMTLLGKITLVQRILPYGKTEQDCVEYHVDGENYARSYAESEIDKIIIKPKRNIDHIIELLEDGKEEQSIDFYVDCVKDCRVGIQLAQLLAPYIEPSKHPQLTPDELKAVKWLVDGGFETIWKSLGCYGHIIMCESENGMIAMRQDITFSPIAQPLRPSLWLTSEPINLKELLDAQEDNA